VEEGNRNIQVIGHSLNMIVVQMTLKMAVEWVLKCYELNYFCQ
jgi:hypothetical protein